MQLPITESLESRTHLSATVTFGDDRILITADDAGATVELQMLNKRRFSLTIDGVLVDEFDAKRGRRIEFRGGAGDDVYRVGHIFDDPATRTDEQVLFSARAFVVAGAGNDAIFDGYGNSKIDGGEGNDTLRAGGGSDTVVGGAGDDDVLAGPDASDPLTRDGDDVVFAGSGNDTVTGGRGRDAIFGQDGADVLTGDTGRDALYGGPGDDVLDGGTDRDIIFAGGQAGDLTVASPGDDRERRGDLDDFDRYLERLIRISVPRDMRADARA